MLSSLYLQIARDAIKTRFNGLTIDKQKLLALHSELGAKQATFVTLTLHKKLRGCIGSIIAHRPLIDDLIGNADAAAFHDPRFSPLSSEEFEEVKIEVSLLSHPRLVDYRDVDELSHIIRPNIDGVILRYENYQATFLPQVWEEIGDFESFFAHLGIKAGLGSNPLSFHPEIYTYQVEKIKES